ncbi:MAG: hypothetical protein WAT21_13450 [Saprospiraceae bacterium]
MGGRNTNATPAQSPARCTPLMRALLYFIILTMSTSSFVCAQTITPIYFSNDSIDLLKIQFINPKTGQLLKIKGDKQLLDITEAYPDTIKIIIPFKNGTQIVLDTVQAKYLDIFCVVNVGQNPLANPNCSVINYFWGDLLRIRTLGSGCSKNNNSIDISFNGGYYSEKTKDLGINLSERLNSKENSERWKNRRNNQ